MHWPLWALPPFLLPVAVVSGAAAASGCCFWVFSAPFPSFSSRSPDGAPAGSSGAAAEAAAAAAAAAFFFVAFEEEGAAAAEKEEEAPGLGHLSALSALIVLRGDGGAAEAEAPCCCWCRDDDGDDEDGSGGGGK